MALQVKQMAGFWPKLPQKIRWISVWSSSTFLVKSCKHLTKKCSASGIDSLFHHRKAGGSVILVRDVLPKGRPKMSFLVGLWPSELVVLLARFRFPMHDASCGAVSPVFLRRSLRGSRLQEHLFESEWKNTTHGGLKHRTCFFIVIVIQIMHIVWILNLE